jgi:superfamily I DNA/RNA helicase
MQIYELYNRLEEWKLKARYYDLMDLSMHCIRMIKTFGYNGPAFHFMMVDEIQDLPFSISFLISYISHSSFFFCGDNAQNIAKGISYKFADLMKLFDSALQD